MISFVVPVKNDADRLRACLRRIGEDAPAGVAIEIIVADNGSTDGSGDVARSAGALVLDLPGTSLGDLRNRAAARARGDVLAFVDADNEIATGWSAAALDGLQMTRTGAVGAPYRAPSPGTWVQRLYDGLRRHPTDLAVVEWLGSGNLAVRRAAFEAVGGFDTTLETCEDVDLCRKLRRQGYVLLADARMRSVHHGDPTTLGQVFFGELWRGRDNLRVSLRPPLTARTLASAALPLANLTAGVILVGGLLSRPPGGAGFAAGAAAVLAGTVLARAATIERAGESQGWLKAVAVAAAYEAGRAFAVVGRFRYGHRRRTAPARGTA